MQIASRLLLVWAVTYPFPHLAASPAYASMLLAWSVTEVIRYSYFGMNVAASPPSGLTWLRYNAFFVLYPLGILSEVWLVLSAAEPAGEVWAGFEWGLYTIMAIYVPGETFRSLGGLGCCVVWSANWCRFVRALHAHDQAAEEGHEEAERREEGAVIWPWRCAECAGVMWTCPRVAMLSSIVLSK